MAIGDLQHKGNGTVARGVFGDLNQWTSFDAYKIEGMTDRGNGMVALTIAVTSDGLDMDVDASFVSHNTCTSIYEVVKGTILGAQSKGSSGKSLDVSEIATSVQTESLKQAMERMIQQPGSCEIFVRLARHAFWMKPALFSFCSMRKMGTAVVALNGRMPFASSLLVHVR